ncbi:MAG: hypothetical protein COB14_03545 [Alphaproteobacteria bacterium]|nr:MAG: hypothetical protein COB14_03545 [Alphaproteobacteria bacterium]
MKYLLRASSHGNKITVIDNLVDTVIGKMSCDPYGIVCLGQEQRGIEWYADNLNMSADDLIADTYFSDRYGRINIKKFIGKQVSYKQPYLKNKTYLENCIQHYLDTWPKDDMTAVHGDLTLDNVIFTPDGARFFDWEHFTQEPHPWGFDILYCLLSALLLPLGTDQFPTKADYTKFIEHLFTLFDHGLSPDLAEYPLSRYRKIFRTKSCWKDIIERSPHKLFPLRYSELYIDIVDDQITRRIRHKRYDIFKKSALSKEE